VRRVPVIVPPNQYNLPYLETKRKRMGHLFDLEQGDEFVADESARSG